MDIATNLKRLRQCEDLTQEELALHIGCSPQAISRWERNEGYPEITLLPVIANFFNVTIDELCGMEAKQREVRMKEIRDEYIRIFSDYSRGGSRSAATYLKTVLPEYPNAYQLWLELAQILAGLVQHGEAPSEEDKREAIVILERIVKHCKDEYICNNALVSLATLYQNLGEQETAEKTVEKFHSSALLLRDEVAARIYRGEKQIQAIQEQIVRNARNIWNYTRFAVCDTYVFDADVDCFGYTVEERIKILEKGAKILELLTDDGELHVFALCIAINFRGMAILASSIGQYDRALDYLDKCADYALEETQTATLHGNVKYTSVLTNRIKCFTGGNVAGDTYNVMTRTDEYTRHEFDPIRNNPRFLAIAERLKTMTA